VVPSRFRFLVTDGRRAGRTPSGRIPRWLSPWSDRRDRSAKAALSARYGIRHYWIPDPVGTLDVYEVRGTEYRRVAVHEGAARVRTTLFPDLEIDLGRVWVP